LTASANMTAQTPSATAGNKGRRAGTIESRSSSPSRNEDGEAGGTNPTWDPVIEIERVPAGLTGRESIAEQTEAKTFRKLPPMAHTSAAPRPPSSERQANTGPKPIVTGRRRQASIASATGLVAARMLDIPTGKRCEG